MKTGIICAGVGALLLLGGCRPADPLEPVLKQADFEQEMLPVLEEFCYDCHGDGAAKGGLALDDYLDLESIRADPKTWDVVVDQLRGHIMPPPKKPQPDLTVRHDLADRLEAFLHPVNCADPFPGQITLRRLNRVELQHTLNDLFTMSFDVAEALPPDDTGYGFDTVGDTLVFSPMFMEKIVRINGEVLDAVFASTPTGARRDIAGMDFSGAQPYEQSRILSTTGNTWKQVSFERAGSYSVRFRLSAHHAGDELPRVQFLLDGKSFEGGVEVPSTYPNPTEHVIELSIGQPKTVKLEIRFLNDAYFPDAEDRSLRDRNLIVMGMEVVGPRYEGEEPRSPGYRRWMTGFPEGEAEALTEARQVLRRFGLSAWRRPLTDADLDRLMRFVAFAREEGDSFEGGVRLAMQAILSSPRFLYRDEPETLATQKTIRGKNARRNSIAADEFALASRLSYFLWSSGPDDELLQLAQAGQLRAQLDTQVDRMVQDPRIQRFVEAFTGQWLQLRNLALTDPNEKTFPEFDANLKKAMRRETEQLFLHILQEDRSVSEFLYAPYTFVNERLARHYGLEGVEGEQMRKVVLPDARRGGLLTQAAILTLTSNPARTSPVKRGKFVLENLLGLVPPPAPDNVPDLEESAPPAKGASLRDRLELHRDSPNCASCHALMDPIGFALEHYDATGAWRTSDGGGAIDASGVLITGEAFTDGVSFRNILVEKKVDDLVGCLSEKLLIYALGRGPIADDRCFFENVARRARNEEYRFSALLKELIFSDPFQRIGPTPGAAALPAE